MTRRSAVAVASLAMVAALAACGSLSPEAPSPAAYDWTPPTTVMRVTGRAAAPVVAAGGGRAYVTWLEDASPLVTMRLAADGTWVLPETLFASPATEVTMAADAAGGAVAAWTAPHSSIPNIECLYTATLRPSQAWTPRFELACFVVRMDLAVGSSGHATIAWTENPIFALRALRYVPGEGWFYSGDLTAGERGGPMFDVAVDADGSAAAVWEDYGESDSAIGVGFAAPVNSGAPGWATRQLAAPFPGQSEPRVAFESRGLAVATWSGGDGRGIQAARVTRSDTIATGLTGNPDDRCPAIAGSGSGTSALAWSRRWPDPARLHLPGVFGAMSDRGTWQVAPITTGHALPPRCPQAAMDADGRAVVAWEEGGFADMTSEVWASARHTAAGGWAPAVRLAAGAAQPSVAIGGGVAYVVWVSESGDMIQESRLRLAP